MQTKESKCEQIVCTSQHTDPSELSNQNIEICSHISEIKTDFDLNLIEPNPNLPMKLYFCTLCEFYFHKGNIERIDEQAASNAIIENLENCNAHIFMKQIPSICSTNSKKQIMESYINVDMSISKTKTLLPAFIDGGSTICLIHPDILKLIPNENIEKKSSETSYMIGINGKISPIKSKVFITFTIDNDKYQHLFHECWKWQ